PKEGPGDGRAKQPDRKSLLRAAGAAARARLSRAIALPGQAALLHEASSRLSWISLISLSLGIGNPLQLGIKLSSFRYAFQQDIALQGKTRGKRTSTFHAKLARCGSLDTLVADLLSSVLNLVKSDRVESMKRDALISCRRLRACVVAWYLVIP